MNVKILRRSEISANNCTPKTSSTAKNIVQRDFGDKLALISEMNPLIHRRLSKLCKQFCYQNWTEYQCTLSIDPVPTNNDKPLCEWGNATYAWIVDDLFKDSRIAKIPNTELDKLTKYFSKILYSLPFIERFKDWRFRRRIRVPEYIKAIHPTAHKVYWLLCDSDAIPNIAQRVGLNEYETKHIVRNIHSELQKRGKIYLLKTESVVSLTNMNVGNTDPIAPQEEWGIPHYDLSLDETERRQAVKRAYDQLNWKEQYIVDAMVIGGITAKMVLKTLQEQNISLDDKIPIDKLTDQKIYYFLRKTLDKLRRLAKI